ncbi:S-adenosyl-L-methionine dependent methyltransferase [Athelia psychrophila]|uniref:S-adenosyl-L-methionine dependent methyltransferase n=1 Tax=Athelia psychrophila TaxID=1759441 RepID=A0A167VZ51_9AGAM|nr:S-adenosyl-L-methionine dependent methyltransferase [Fibularhizoctonia sp. CBS 109695]
MHPRKPYRTPPDSAALARSFPELKPYVSRKPNGPVSVDYQDDMALRCLARASLYRDFGLSVDLPKDRLRPTVCTCCSQSRPDAKVVK